MLLSDRDILNLVESGEIKISPFVRAQLLPAAYYLRLDRKVRFTRIGDATHLDVKSPLDVTEAVDVGKGGLISVRPGEIVLGSSVESVGLGKNVAGLLQNRTSLSRLGLMVDASSGLLSPGSEGRLTLVIQNNFSLPIRIYAGMRIARISFVQMSSEVITAYGGRYQRQQEATASRIWEDFVK